MQDLGSLCLEAIAAMVGSTPPSFTASVRNVLRPNVPGGVGQLQALGQSLVDALHAVAQPLQAQLVAGECAGIQVRATGAQSTGEEHVLVGQRHTFGSLAGHGLQVLKVHDNLVREGIEADSQGGLLACLLELHPLGLVHIHVAEAS
jgi:hypothetical protein